jgi:hypothetical protein
MAVHKISFFRGDTPLITLTIPLVGDLLTANPSTYQADFTLTSNSDPGPTDSDAAIQINSTPVASGSAWTASFQLTNTQTQNLDPNLVYHYDVQLAKLDSTFVSTVDSGICIIETDYTRRVP